MSSVKSLFDAFIVMIICIFVGGIMIISFAVPSDAINQTLSTSMPFTQITAASGWQGGHASKSWLLVAQRMIGILIILVGIINMFLTAVRREEKDDTVQYQYPPGGY